VRFTADYLSLGHHFTKIHRPLLVLSPFISEIYVLYTYI